VKVALPEPVVSVVIVPRYRFGGHCKVTGSDALNPLTVAVTVEPAEPEVGLNDVVCALTNGVIITANVNALRKSTISIVLLNFFSIFLSLFCKFIIPFPNA
jgi:hypothetical protein